MVRTFTWKVIPWGRSRRAVLNSVKHTFKVKVRVLFGIIGPPHFQTKLLHPFTNKPWVSETEVGHLPNIQGYHLPEIVPCSYGRFSWHQGVKEANNNSSHGKRYSSVRDKDKDDVFFVLPWCCSYNPSFFSGISGPGSHYRRWGRRGWLAVDAQALVFLTVQQWHMKMRFHQRHCACINIPRWLMKMPDGLTFKLAVSWMFMMFILPGHRGKSLAFWRAPRLAPSATAVRTRGSAVRTYTPWSRRYAPRFWRVPAWCAFPPLRLGCTRKDPWRSGGIPHINGMQVCSSETYTYIYIYQQPDTVIFVIQSVVPLL